MISTTGLNPASARPMPVPTMAASLMGVESTRSGNSVDSPAVTLNAPPYGSARSSPSTTTRSSVDIKRVNAALSDARPRISDADGADPVDAAGGGADALTADLGAPVAAVDDGADACGDGD